MKPSIIGVGLLVLHCTIFFSACATLSHNFFRNPSFEAGKAHWYWREGNPSWNGFEITDERAHTGKFSARLSLRGQPDLPPARIWGVIQGFQFDRHRTPGELEFWYRVENWRQTVKNQYIQAVVIFHGKNILPSPPTFNHIQIRYILAGLEGPPYPAANVRYLLIGPPKPKEGEWIYFKRDIVEDFSKLWGWFPKKFEKVEFFFEVRYDDPPSPENLPQGDVYWDDFSVS